MPRRPPTTDDWLLLLDLDDAEDSGEPPTQTYRKDRPAPSKRATTERLTTEELGAL